MSEYEDPTHEVRFEAAFAWTCPNCAHRNYEEGEVVATELTPEHRAKLAALHGCDPEDVVAEYCHIPARSECAICCLPVHPAPDPDDLSPPSQD